MNRQDAKNAKKCKENDKGTGFSNLPLLSFSLAFLASWRFKSLIMRGEFP
jgi:hypothetical protein